MGFQLKDFRSITAAMINRARATQTKLTDFNVGSVARTLMEAPAVEIEEFYQRMFAGIMDAIPVAIYRGFDFPMQEKAKARGTVTLTFAQPLSQAFTVPAGSVFNAPALGVRYLSLAALTAPAGATSAAIAVEAENVGAAYNVPANAISAVQGLSLPTGAVIGNAPVTSGSDGESEIERASRFAEYIGSISRGTLPSVEYAASTAKVRNVSGEVVEEVSRIGSDEAPGEARVYIYGSGQVASPALVAAAQQVIDGYYDQGAQAYVPGYSPVGVNVLVMPMTEEPRSVALTVTLADGFTLADVRGDVITRVAQALDRVESGSTLYAEAINDAALRALGVMSVRHDLTANYVCPRNVVLTPGTITVALG